MTTALATRTQVDKRAVSIGQTTPALTVLPSPAEAAPLTVQQVLGQVALIQQIMGAAMKDGEHFGKIPGCGDKPTLLKPGAEKLCLTFRLAPTYDVIERALDQGHREYRVTATLTSILTQALIGQGVGFCTTMEGKYRFRAGAAEPTDKPVPRAYWDLRQEDPAKAQELIGGKGFTVKKVEGQGWMIAKGGEKVEHDNPADHFNTVLKMAKKRALVDAVLTATAASDIFTQDLEDIRANLELAAPAPAPAPVPSPAPAPAVQADGGSGTRPPTAAPVAAAAAPEPDPAPAPAPAPTPAKPKRAKAAAPAGEAPADFRLTPIHFGKNRGIALGLLTPQQIHWYEEVWMPRWEGTTNATAEDRRLMDSLKAYRVHRNDGKARKAAAAAEAAQPAAA